MKPWSVEAGAESQEATGSTWALAIDIDPRQQRVRLDLQITSGGPQELWQGAVFRRFFVCTEASWAPALAWLSSERGREALDTVVRGYSAEMLWTGDWVAEWSEEAMDAAHTIYDEIARLLDKTAED